MIESKITNENKEIKEESAVKNIPFQVVFKEVKLKEGNINEMH